MIGPFVHIYCVIIMVNRMCRGCAVSAITSTQSSLIRAASYAASDIRQHRVSKSVAEWSCVVVMYCRHITTLPLALMCQNQRGLVQCYTTATANTVHRTAPLVSGLHPFQASARLSAWRLGLAMHKHSRLEASVARMGGVT